eukprot:752240-Hanusia_phi.AAC.2
MEGGQGNFGRKQCEETATAKEDWTGKVRRLGRGTGGAQVERLCLVVRVGYPFGCERGALRA